MDIQEAIQALMDGKKMRQINWLPGDYIIYWKQTWITDEQTKLPIYEPKAGLLFYNKIEDVLGLISEEDATKAFNIPAPWEILNDD